MDTNIIYSMINKELLERYYSDNFLNENEKGLKMESVLRWIYNIGGVCAGLILAKNIHMPLWNILKDHFVQEDTRSLPTDLVQAGAAYLLVFWIGLFLYIKSINTISTLLFPLHHRLCVEEDIRISLWNHYNEIIEFQELMRTKNITKISTDGYSSITADYVDTNSITKTKTLRMGGHYSDTMKESCLDFSWVDSSINQELTQWKYKGISV